MAKCPYWSRDDSVLVVPLIHPLLSRVEMPPANNHLSTMRPPRVALAILLATIAFIPFGNPMTALADERAPQ